MTTSVAASSSQQIADIKTAAGDGRTQTRRNTCGNGKRGGYEQNASINSSRFEARDFARV